MYYWGERDRPFKPCLAICCNSATVHFFDHVAETPRTPASESPHHGLILSGAIDFFRFVSGSFCGRSEHKAGRNQLEIKKESKVFTPFSTRFRSPRCLAESTALRGATENPSAKLLNSCEKHDGTGEPLACTETTCLSYASF